MAALKPTRAGALIAGLACAAALLALPAAAAAKPGFEVERPALLLTASLPPSHGYSLSLSTFGHKQVSLFVRKGKFLAFYNVNGSVSRDRIKANLGRFGRVSLRFEGKPVKLPPERRGRGSCKGKAPILERGTFRGTVEFQGEQGYTEASAKHARGSMFRSFRRVCPKGHDGLNAVGISWRRPGASVLSRLERDKADGLGFTFSILSAASGRGGRLTTFSAANLELPGAADEWSAAAALFEKVGRVAVSKSIAVEATSAQVEVDQSGKGPVMATVALPRPFRGSASFDGAAEPRPTWTGTLSVAVPGLGTVPLAGPDFVASYCRAANLNSILSCLPE